MFSETNHLLAFHWLREVKRWQETVQDIRPRVNREHWESRSESVACFGNSPDHLTRLRSWCFDNSGQTVYVSSVNSQWDLNHSELLVQGCSSLLESHGIWKCFGQGRNIWNVLEMSWKFLIMIIVELEPQKWKHKMFLFPRKTRAMQTNVLIRPEK